MSKKKVIRLLASPEWLTQMLTTGHVFIQEAQGEMPARVVKTEHGLPPNCSLFSLQFDPKKQLLILDFMNTEDIIAFENKKEALFDELEVTERKCMFSSSIDFASLKKGEPS